MKGTYERISRHCWWPHMYKDVEQWVKTCQTCQLHRRPPHHLRRKGYRNVPKQVWEHVFVDTISLPTTKHGFTHVFVCIDFLSRFAVCKPVRNATGQAFAEWLVLELIPQFGCPSHLTSDRGTEFVNEICDRMMSVMEIHHRLVTAYRPTANGLVERLNGTIKTMIRKYAEFDKIQQWATWLPFITFAYNNSVHTATG